MNFPYRNIVVLTGAGISAESGIQTFRAQDGLWENHRIEDVATPEGFLRDPDLVREACKAFPGQVALGIDSRNGFVAVEGWADVTELKTEDLAKQFEDAGASALIFTDIGRDGAMQGPNLEATISLANAVDIPVILSGGVSSMDDLHQIKAEAGDMFEGVISGRAVYDGRIDPASAVQLLQGSAGQ